ncbi:nucleolar protein 11-like [Xenia sp. Carnegie-2017]|uniref:nucleolar protein 11-like n=1 Tax=Xenia sp. Carnegie-2017 TaxID=2897299 RepID=UPI001F04C1AA|nr:nucleolar protein 11-like [Xenia sp. Carnegie-2017]
MATLGESFGLCNLETELIGVEKHGKDDHIILTLESKEVMVYNIREKKVVHSWCLEGAEKFTCPVVHDDGMFYAIKNEKWLLMWEDSLSELCQSSMLKLPRAAVKIQACKCSKFQHEPVIIFKDNEALPFSKVGNEQIRKSSKTTESLLWCDLHKRSDGNIWFTKLLTSKDNRKLTLIMHLFKENKINTYNLEKIDDSELIDWAVVEDESLYFISLWSNGKVYRIDVPGVSPQDERNSELSFEELFVTFQISQFQQFLANLTTVKSSFVCVAGFFNRDLQNCKVYDCITVWDTKFNTLHCEKPFPECLKATLPSRLFLQSTSSFIIIASDTSVSAIPFSAEKSTLKSSLGILEENNKKPQFLTTPSLFHPSKSIEEWKRDVLRIDETENEILCKLLDGKKTNTAKKLLLELKKTTEKCSTSNETVSQFLVTSVFERCANEKEMWTPDIGNLILNTAVLPSRYFSQFLSLVMEKNDMLLFRNCLCTLKGIPESCLVECLKFILRYDDVMFSSPAFVPDVWVETSPPCPLSKAKMISLVLSHPINDAFLQSSLRKLNFDDVMILLQFLLHIMKCWSPLLNDVLCFQESLHKPTYSKILDWSALILNAHFTQMILVPDSQTLLINFHKIVGEQIISLEHLEQLDGYLTHFKDHESLPYNNRMSSYSIEQMEL